MKFVLAALLAVTVIGCALPDTNIRTGSPRPTLYVKGAPEGSLLFVDGLAIGSATEFNGNPKTLIVEEGTHTVELRRAGAVIHTEKVFVSNGESRSISVNSGAR